MDRRSWWFDATIAAGVIIVGQLDGWLGVTATHRQGPHWAEALLYAIGGALLLWRRARPLAVLSAIVAAAVVEFATFGSPEGFGVEMPALIAAYSVARWEQRRSTWWALPLLGVYGAAWILLDPLQITATQRFGGLFWVSQLFIGWLIGALVRGRLRTLEQRRLRRAEHQQRAIAEERTRIARELHDVIGHSVSVMTLQAAAVRRRLTPEQAAEREALESVEAVGREAMTEMRRMVAVLRDRNELVGREPPPSLAQVEGLVENFRSAGLPVELRVTGTLRHLAPGLDLAAYRVVQEGLTNVLRHAADPRRAVVTIDYATDRLGLHVRDDGAPLPAEVQYGDGLLGLQERVAMNGGTFQAGPLPDRGFELRTTLPLEAP